jgi:hypothetical protein
MDLWIPKDSYAYGSYGFLITLLVSNMHVEYEYSVGARPPVAQ